MDPMDPISERFGHFWRDFVRKPTIWGISQLAVWFEVFPR